MHGKTPSALPTYAHSARALSAHAFPTYDVPAYALSALADSKHALQDMLLLPRLFQAVCVLQSGLPASLLALMLLHCIRSSSGAVDEHRCIYAQKCEC
eukprot:1156703-Pelagomonas_calceolata.AAC.1